MAGKTEFARPLPAVRVLRKTGHAQRLIDYGAKILIGISPWV